MFGCRKTFYRKYIFFGNANFRKRKIFLCVWLYFKKFSGKYFLVFGKEGGKHKTQKTQKPQPRKSRSRRREIAINGAVSPSRDRDQHRDLATVRSRVRDLAVDASRDRTVDRDLWHSRRTARSGLWLVFFLNLCFPSSFPNTRKYFPENFLKCNQTPDRKSVV